MTSSTGLDQLLLEYRRCITSSTELLQNDLLSPQQLLQYAKDRNIRIFNQEKIKHLWRIGIIRADLVVAEKEIKRPALELISADDAGIYTYLDTRKLRRRKKGYGGSFSKKPPVRKDIELYFHPFRLFVLYHVERVFSIGTNSTQYLNYPEGQITVSKMLIEHMDKWTSTQQYCDLFDKWNKTAELAIIFEPISYQEVYRSFRWGFPDDEDTARAKREKYSKDVLLQIPSINTADFEEHRKDLCQNAELVDSNKLLHVLIHLTSWYREQKMKGAIGECMLFLSMAEIIRRTLERTLDQKLPEEDQLGFGQWMPGARKMLYGTDRVFDADQKVLREFLSGIGIDYGTKVRCYLEGETELGALKHAVGELNGIEFVNLRGHFIEKRGKGLAFMGSLKNDIKSHVFSIVLLDGDRQDFTRVVKKAAEEEHIFGRYFISTPDFEFSNFSLEELVEILVAIANKDDIEGVIKEDLLSDLVGVSSSKDLFRILGQTYPQLNNIRKGERWGQELMDYAIKNPKSPSREEEGGANNERPIIEAARVALIGRKSGYIKSLDKYKVSPDTGTLIEREK